MERLGRAPETAYAIYKHSPNCVTKLFEDQKQPTRQSGSLNDLYGFGGEFGGPPAKMTAGQLMRAHSTSELLSSQDEWMFQLRSLISEGTTLMRQLSNQVNIYVCIYIKQNLLRGGRTYYWSVYYAAKVILVFPIRSTNRHSGE